LVLGRETGPIAQLLRKNVPKMKIGAVDILGNMETREFADWKFSVVKQGPGISLGRKKQKSTMVLLFELAKVMLEEKEFDQLIPLAPFNKSPSMVKQLRKECDIPLTTQDSLETTYSDFRFIKALIEHFPGFDTYFKRVNLRKDLDQFKNGLVITEINRFSNTSEIKNKGINIPSTDGFYIPIESIHCAGFFSVKESVNFLGFQSLKSPEGGDIAPTIVIEPFLTGDPIGTTYPARS